MPFEAILKNQWEKSDFYCFYLNQVFLVDQLFPWQKKFSVPCFMS